MQTAISSPAMAARPSKVLTIALWIVQIPLGVVFIMAGVMKLSQPPELLAQTMIWPGDVPEPFLRFIGAVNLTGGLGLILPSTTRIRPGLAPLAALAIVVLMILALGFHTVRGEFFAYPLNLTLGACAAFVAWGRFKKAPIAPR